MKTLKGSKIVEVKQ